MRNFMKQYMHEIIMNATAKDGAKEVINKLKAEGHKIVIITSRNDEYFIEPYRNSELWLKKQGIMYDKLIVNGTDKAKECIENDIDVFIDDHTYFLDEVNQKTNTKIFMFDSPYNQECTNYTRVNSWKEVYEKIKEIK